MIDLPSSPGPVSVSWQQIDFGGKLTPGLGGAVQRVNRLGNRFAVTVQLPPMAPATAMPWIVALNKAVQEGARWAIRQVELAIGTPGNPTVNGSLQAGNALNITGAAANYPFQAGQFIAVTISGDRYLHLVTAPVTCNGAGTATLPILPALRAPTVTGGAVLVAAPTIEGLLADGNQGWTIERARRVGMSFTITEQK